MPKRKEPTPCPKGLKKPPPPPAPPMPFNSELRIKIDGLRWEEMKTEGVVSPVLSGECPSCARIAAKMKDREGLAQFLWSLDAPKADISEWDKFTPRLKEPYLKDADDLIRWMKE